MTSNQNRPAPPTSEQANERLQDLALMVARKLVALVPDRVEVDHAALEDPKEFDWRILGPAFIYRGVGTVEAACAIAQATRRDTDVHALLRSLCEGVITFGWLAAGDNETDRIRRWRRGSLEADIKMHNAYAKLDLELFDPTQLAAKQAALASLPEGTDLDLASMAVHADKHWNTDEAWRLPSYQVTFSSLYTMVFRTASVALHYRPDSFAKVVTQEGNQVVARREPRDGIRPSLSALVALATTLVLAAQATLGTPRRDDIDRIFETHGQALIDAQRDQIIEDVVATGDLTGLQPHIRDLLQSK
jgi:hypothetical protein